MKNLDLSIIIVNYNTRDLLKNCLLSLEKYEDFLIKDNEVFVIDNASTDGSTEMVQQNFPWVKLISNSVNQGFARANNKAIQVSRGQYLLLLNPDTIIPLQTLPFMIKFMETYPKVGVATCRVELINGQLDWASHRGFPTPRASLAYFLGLEKLFPKLRVFSQYHQTYKNLNETHEIDSPCGAFFMIRRKVIEEIGLFDQDYFMYAEDIDFAYRAKSAGWKVMFVPEVKIIHYKGIASGLKKHTQHLTTAGLQTKIRTTNNFYDTMKIFYRKHYWKKYPFFVNYLVLLGVNLKQKLSLRNLKN